jgi:phosphatidate phosphatase APP1
MTKDDFLRLANRAETRIDNVRYRMRQRFPSGRPITILPYRGFGNSDKIWMKGRVLEDNAISIAKKTDRVWANLRNTYKRFDSHEVPGARVNICCCGSELSVKADEEGFFEAELQLRQPAKDFWQEVVFDLLEPTSMNAERAHSTGSVMIPPRECRFGVISDLDDTVIRTGSRNLFRMLQTTLIKNAYTRLPFPGVAAFYRALQDGYPSGTVNPLFYVSSSPWNLYDVLIDFMAVQRIPIGPVFLQDWGLSEKGFLPTQHRVHKLSLIRKILDTYPQLSFLLMGDSAQKDPEIYQEVVSLYPHRILAIYIRNVTQDPARTKAIQTLAETVSDARSTLVLSNDTLAAATHAEKQGWISLQRLREIQLESVAVGQ